MVDAETQAKPSVVDIGINNTSVMSDAMVGEDAPDKYTFSDDDTDEIQSQKTSKQAVAQIFDVYPILADTFILLHLTDVS